MMTQIGIDARSGQPNGLVTKAANKPNLNQLGNHATW